MNPNATNVAHIRSDLMLCRVIKNLIEDHICQRCVWRPLQSNEAAETMAVKTPTSNNNIIKGNGAQVAVI